MTNPNMDMNYETEYTYIFMISHLENSMNPAAEKLIHTLQEEIQFALENAVVGKTLRPYMSGQLKRTAQGILIRHRIRNANIQVVQQGAGFSVSITLPPQGPIVQAVRLRFGPQDPMY